MPQKLLSDDTFREAMKAGNAAEGTLFKFATAESQTVGEDAARTQRFVFSTNAVDHSGDSIDQKGWDLSVFKRNPVSLFAHMSWDPPIGRASNVGIEKGELVGDIEFASAEVYPFADTIYQLVKGKFLNAVSVGFLPKEYAFTNDKNRPYGIDFKKQLLLEISVCPVPCNPEALGEARSVGVDTRPLCEWAEKVLDSGDVVFLPRTELEGLRVQAKGSALPLFYFEATRSLKPAEAISVREAAKGYRSDPTTTLILPEGVTLRTIEPEPAEFDSEAEAAGVEAAIGEAIKSPTEDLIRRAVGLALKAGRRISAATKAKIVEAMGHHEAGMKCMKDIMDGDGADDEPDGDDGSGGDVPAGSVLPDRTVEAEPVKDLSTPEGRLEYARSLRAALPKND